MKELNNKSYSNKIRRIKNKIESIKILGGKCSKCGEDNIFKLTFHHRDPKFKESNVCKYFTCGFKLFKEIEKCDLLCNNCHREHHYSEISKYGGEIRNDKKIYLNYSGAECAECGYDKCPGALTFHHEDPSKKVFPIGSLFERIESIVDISERIKEELDKCIVLCANCHVYLHSAHDFYDENKIEIENYNIKKISQKVDRELVFKMNKEGLKNIEISKKLKCGKSTISDILRGRLESDKKLKNIQVV